MTARVAPFVLSIVLVASTLLGSGCGPRHVRDGPFAPAVGEEFAVWMATIDDGEIGTEYVALRPDGTFGWNYDQPGDFQFEAGERWRVEGDTLVLSWSDGYAEEVYDLTAGDDGVYPGQKRSQSWGPSELRSCHIRRLR